MVVRFAGSSWSGEVSGGTFVAGYAKKIVLHTTEGSNWPNYSGNAPHITIKWDANWGRFEVRQHIDLDSAARALKIVAGGGETNRGGAIQVEIIGTCSEGNSIKPYWPGASDQMLKALGLFVRQLAGGVKVKTTIAPLVAYPASYGSEARQRFSATTWRNFNGICGHQHVPENDHGDPGALNLKRAMDLSMPQEENEVPRKKAPDMFVGLYGSTRYRLVTGDRYLGISEELALSLKNQGVPFVAITEGDNASLLTLVSEVDASE